VGGDAKQAEVLALFDEGRVAAARGDHTLAVAKLRTAVALVPSVASLAALGTSLSRLAFHAEAVVYLAAAVGLGGATAALRIQLAVAIAEAGDRPEALRRLRDLRRELPSDPEVHLELLRIVSDPQALARIADRQRLLEGIRAALPEVRIAEGDSLIRGLEKVGWFINAWASAPVDPQRLERAFLFLDSLAASPDQEVADLLTAVVFPTFSRWSSPVDAARAMLGGQARRALDDALALWGPPTPGDPPLAGDHLVDTLESRLPGFEAAKSSIGIGSALGRHFVTTVEGGAPSTEIERLGIVLSRMADSGDAVVREAFDDALAEVLRASSPEILRAAHRNLSRLARTALENLTGRDQLG
jgi:hypothetical protein